MMPRFIVLFAITFSLPLVAADFQKSYDNAANRRITVFTVHGDINLSSYDGKTIDISAIKKGPDRDRVEIQDASFENQIHIFPRYLEPTHSNATVDFEIRVPKELFYDALPNAKIKAQVGDSVGLGSKSKSGDGTETPDEKSKPPKNNDMVVETENKSKSQENSNGVGETGSKQKPQESSDSVEGTDEKPKHRVVYNAEPGAKLKPQTAQSYNPNSFFQRFPGERPTPPAGGRWPHAIYLKSNSGQITVLDVSGSIRVETGGRNIEVRNVAGRIYASSVSGDIIGTLKQFLLRSMLEFSSISGNISVHAPDDINAQVRIESLTGQVKTDFPLETRTMRYGPGKLIQGKLGAGNHVLNIRSVSGAISFTKRPPVPNTKPQGVAVVPVADK